MRRALIPIFTLILIVGLTSLPWGTMSSSRTVDLIIDGQPVQSRVPARLVGSRTMVPVRIISERLGAEVLWLADTRQVQIQNAGTSILLSIGRTRVTVNGQDSHLDVAPFIEDGTTLVPIRFVSEMLGATVDWDGDTYTVHITAPGSAVPGNPFKLTDVRYEDVNGMSHLVIETRGQAPFEIISLDQGSGPYARILVRLSRTESLLERPGFPLGGILLRGRATTAGDPPVTEIVVELLEPTSHKVLPVAWDPASGTQKITLALQDQVRGIQFHESESGAWVDVATTGQVFPTAFRLTDPHRLVLDLPGLTLSPELARTLPIVDFPDLVSMRLGLFQATPPIARVVVDSLQPISYDVEASSRTIRIHIYGQLTSLVMDRDGDLETIVLTASTGVSPDITYDRHNQRLLIDLPRVRYDGHMAPVISPDSTLKSVTITETPVTVDSGQKVLGTRIIVGLANYGGHELKTVDGQAVVTLGNLPLAGRIIVLDPGHGGNDPGAISTSGLTEKVVNMYVARRLESLLLEAGATVYLTRTGDYNPTLEERIEMANQLGAHAFLSIHHNADIYSQTRGTETYYANNHPHSFRLAQIVHRALLADLGLPDRSIRYRETFRVLREADMPSILSEAAFLSNPVEALLLQDLAFRDRIAASLYGALVEFFGQ